MRSANETLYYAQPSVYIHYIEGAAHIGVGFLSMTVIFFSSGFCIQERC